ncbi:hypothetical protein FACS1894110_20850 [Spirochaetia bacterium]|nr:hypothetical protein FACS1894110_20850 [Spirochaetia bacterium]
MELEYTYWQEKDGWLLGYLNIWPEHWTQGKTKAELEEMLVDLYEFYKEEQEATQEKKLKAGTIKEAPGCRSWGLFYTSITC